MAYLGWYDPDRKKPAREKLRDAMHRFEEKFGEPAQFCLTSPQDAEELAKRGIEGATVQVHPRTYIARYTFYVGQEGA